MAASSFSRHHGDFFLDGQLTEEELSYALAEYGVKGWLELNPDPPGLQEKVQAAGIEWACVPVEPPNFAPDLASHLIGVLDGLPRPTMIHCSTAKRASAVFALYAARNEGSAVEIAKALNLVCSGAPALMGWLESSSTQVIFRQLFDAEYGSSTYTYLLADPQTKEAVLIDPVIELVDRDLAVINDLGLQLVYGINTHCHADHITGTGELKKKVPGMKSGISKASTAKADVYFEHGDIITVGSMKLEVRATPGHTDGCVSYYTKAGGGMVFTGDAVLIRGCGRTDFQQGSAETLYKAVHEQIFTLPDHTKVYPAHDYKGRTSSTVKEERTKNPRLTKPLDEFLEIMTNLKLPYPKKIDASLPANLVCGITD